MTEKKKRGWSREFPTGGKNRKRLDVDWVPPALLRAAKLKAKAEGVSLRVKVLRWLSEWVGQRTVSPAPTLKQKGGDFK